MEEILGMQNMNPRNFNHCSRRQSMAAVHPAHVTSRPESNEQLLYFTSDKGGRCAVYEIDISGVSSIMGNGF